MRLVSIQAETRERGTEDGVDRTPHNWLEADALFAAGMRAMRAREDDQAFRLFSRLCRYTGDAPPDLMSSARTLRDFLDPDHSAKQKAEAMLRVFSPALIRVYDADRDTAEQPPTAFDQADEP